MSRTELIIPSSGSIDMYDDVSTPLNFSISDVREPEKRNASYSKTIKIPGTTNNNLLFGNIFNINTTVLTFNPNAKTYCILIIDGEQQMAGYLQLLNITNNDGLIEYEVSIIGNIGNPFNAMGNAELTDLNFSSGDHLYNYSTQIASWTNTWENYYCYPYIDYGFNNNLAEVDVEDLLPAIFLKSYFIKILQSIGYRYQSNFIDSEFFEKLLVPSNGGRALYTPDNVSPLLFEAEQSGMSSGTITIASAGVGSAIINPFIFTNEISDPSGQYNNATGIWTVGTAGYYDIISTFHFVGTSTDGGSLWILQPSVYQNGSFVASDYQTASGNQSADFNINAANIFLNSGDQIKIVWSLNLQTAQPLGATGTYAITNGTFKNRFVNSGLIEGNTFLLNNAIPLKIKQKDFFLDIIKIFNLFVDVDPMDDKLLIIEPRDDFYSSGTILDWSAKLDHSKELLFSPMAALDFKELNYTYKEDSDYYNKQYSDQYKEIYGRFRKITDNEFQTNIKEIKSIISPTPLVGDPSNDRVIPRIWDVSSSNSVNSKSFNIRLLYLGGVKTTAQSYNYSGRYSGGHSLTQYLYSGHLDDVVAPTLDLSFGVPQEVYYTATTYTTNNLYNRFHRKYIDEITDIDSKIVIGYFYLTKADIRTLDFRNQFYFENQYFLLNKIYDYDPLQHDVTKCEFIKLKNAIRYVPITTIVNGGYTDYVDGYPLTTN